MDKSKKKIRPGIIVAAVLTLGFLVTVFAVRFINSNRTNTKASKKAVSVAKQAVGVADAYLDGKMTGTQANRKMNELYEQMKYVDSLSDDVEYYHADFFIQSDLLLLSSAISLDSIKPSAKGYDKILEDRNELAKAAGLKQRK